MPTPNSRQVPTALDTANLLSSKQPCSAIQTFRVGQRQSLKLFCLSVFTKFFLNFPALAKVREKENYTERFLYHIVKGTLALERGWKYHLTQGPMLLRPPRPQLWGPWKLLFEKLRSPTDINSILPSPLKSQNRIYSLLFQLKEAISSL